jgi:cytochrome P450
MDEMAQRVSADLVVPYDHIHGKEVMAFPPSALDGLREQRRAFYSSCYGGFWVLTRFEDIKTAFQDHELFIQHAGGLPRNPYTRKLIPLMLDPPEHTAYRKLMAPIFSPKQMARLEPIIRTVARRQLDRIAPLGRCDFVDDFALTLPASTYCAQLGLPTEDFPQFNRLSVDLIFTTAEVLATKGPAAAQAFRARTSQQIEDLLRSLLPERRKSSGEDVISILLAAQFQERPLTEEEILNITSLLFFAGTDSTASMIGYSFMFLAEHPELRQQILDDPSVIPKAALELIRFHGFHQIRREVARDTEFAGVHMKKGDIVLLPTGSANHDSRAFDDAMRVDFARDAKLALTFGTGVHRCLGQHLAILQLRIALEEVHAVIRDYRLDPDQSVEYMTSQAKTVPRHIPLVYSPVTN